MKISILKYKYYLLLVLSKFIYSLTSIFSKLASKEDFLSKKYCFYYAIIVVILALYAIIWQQSLKKIPLSTAMMFKPIALILSIFWAIILFGEQLSFKLVLGVILITKGIVVAGGQYE